MVDLWEFKNIRQTSSVYISYGKKINACFILTKEPYVLTYHRVAFCNFSSLQTHVCQPFGQLHAVDPAAGSDVSFAADVDVHFTHWRGENAGRRGRVSAKIHNMVICKGSVGKALTFTL